MFTATFLRFIKRRGAGRRPLAEGRKPRKRKLRSFFFHQKTAIQYANKVLHYR